MPVRIITAGLFAEGPFDYRFFLPFLERVLPAFWYEYMSYEAEFLQVYPLRVQGGNFFRKLATLEGDHSGLGYIFVHFDADHRSMDRILQRKWHPWMAKCRESGRWVPVVPVKMTESWLLSDKNALERTFLLDRRSIDGVLGSSPPEQIQHPKRALSQLRRLALGSHNSMHDVESLLARYIDLAKIRRLPSFQAFEDATRRAFQSGPG